jgi:hypothetical protein
MSISKVRRALLKTQRILGDIDAVTKPGKARRRAKNRIVGRALGRSGVWRKLWR